MILLPPNHGEPLTPMPSRHRGGGLERLLAGRQGQNKVFTLGGVGSPCCPCTPGGCSFIICLINTCPGGPPATNVVVQIFSGATLLATCTTASPSGCCNITLPAGTYTIKANTSGGNPRYSTVNTTSAFACGNTYTFTIGPQSGYFCSPCFLEPIPNSLVVTILGAPHTMGASSASQVCVNAPVASALNAPAGSCSGSQLTNPCSFSGGTISDIVGLDVSSSDSCIVGQTWGVATDCTQPNGSCTPSTTFPFYFDQGCIVAWGPVRTSAGHGSLTRSIATMLSVHLMGRLRDRHRKPGSCQHHSNVRAGIWTSAPITSITITE